MQQKTFDLYSKIGGWLVFFIALTVYWLTVEPTVSYWDAGEYISTSSKLQVGHPPGAPLFQLLGAFFSIFALNESQIALAVNSISVVSSAFVVAFMFWSIVLLFKKFIPFENSTAQKKIGVLASAFIGATSFAFTDSFWFNAGEAEVYAAAMGLVALMFYIGLLWDRDMLKPRGDKWLVLFFFIVGLTFGVHFMGLLTIPAVGYIYYFRTTRKVTPKNFIIASIVVVGILLFVFKLLLPYTLSFFAGAELFFVNSFGLPFHSGTIIAGLIIAGLFYYFIQYTRKKGYRQMNLILLCLLFVLVGFSSWIMLPIRANAGTVINENNPSSAEALLAYYNRDQYPETHLFYGPQFTEIFAGLDKDNPYSDEEPKYEKDEEKGEYVIVNDYKNAKQNSPSEHKSLIPRMWSMEHAENYMNYTGTLDFTIKPDYQGNKRLQAAVQQFRQDYAAGKIGNQGYVRFLKDFRQYLDVEKPSMSSNLRYLIEYQIGYMYWRYFMWNFAGRQSDEQGKLGKFKGNWISGINFLDEMRLGPQENLPVDMKTNKARNTYYLLPLILGIIGLVFHYQKDKKSFWVLSVLFLFTGIALKFYLNERPFEPRERDYALVGSFYVFAMWIGFGVYALFELFADYFKPKIALPVAFVLCLSVPSVLASENWDDHDRSNRYTTLAMAKNYLDGVDKNGILFSIGDNDTFALWYAQEIEGYRRDVRVINTSLFATQWYIDQMRRKAYSSEPVETYLEHKNYTYGTNEAVWHQEDPRLPDTLLIDKWIKYIKSDNRSTKAELESGQMVNTFPTKNLSVPVDKNAVIENGIVPAQDRDKIEDTVHIKLTNNIIYKNRLLMLDVLANTDWERPIYFTGGSNSDADYLWLKDHLQLDGMVYKLVPIQTENKSDFEMGRIDTDEMYDIVMNWHWGNSGTDKIYHDRETRKNAITYRSNMARLVEHLIKEGKNEKALNVINLAMEKTPVKHFQQYVLLEPFISAYYKLNKPEKARKIWNQIAEVYQSRLDYYSSFSQNDQYGIAERILTDIERYRSLVDLIIIHDEESVSKEKAAEFNDYLMLFDHFTGASKKQEDEELLKQLNKEPQVDTINSDSSQKQ